MSHNIAHLGRFGPIIVVRLKSWTAEVNDMPKQLKQTHLIDKSSSSQQKMSINAYKDGLCKLETTHRSMGKSTSSSSWSLRRCVVSQTRCLFWKSHTPLKTWNIVGTMVGKSSIRAWTRQRHWAWKYIIVPCDKEGFYIDSTTPNLTSFPTTHKLDKHQRSKKDSGDQDTKQCHPLHQTRRDPPPQKSMRPTTIRSLAFTPPKRPSTMRWTRSSGNLYLIYTPPPLVPKYCHCKSKILH